MELCWHERNYFDSRSNSVIKRTGDVAAFDAEKISVAIGKAFLAVEGQQSADSSRIHDRITQLTEMVLNTFTRRLPSGGTIHIEEIQDQVELALMRTGEHKKSLVLTLSIAINAQVPVKTQILIITLPCKLPMQTVSFNHLI